MKYIYVIFSFAALLLFAYCGNNTSEPDANLQRESDERLIRPDSMEPDNTAVADSSEGTNNPNVGMGGK